MKQFAFSLLKFYNNGLALRCKNIFSALSTVQFRKLGFISAAKRLGIYSRGLTKQSQFLRPSYNAKLYN